MAAAPRPAKKFDRSIVEGPIPGAVWKLAWPTMLHNVIGGLQGIVDHVMVGHASLHTARGMGPSTIERSNFLAGLGGAAM